MIKKKKMNWKNWNEISFADRYDKSKKTEEKNF